MFPVLPPLPKSKENGVVVTQRKLDNGAFVLHNLLSKEECEHLIQSSEREGMTSVSKEGYQSSYRNNDRIQVGSMELAQIVFERAKPFLENVSCSRDGVVPGIKYGLDIEGEWGVVGVNEAFRICKYNPGGHFSPHRDAYYQRTEDERSFMTFMIYLNEEGLEGGHTNFLKDQTLTFNKDKKIYESQPGTVTEQVRPEAGAALCFYHELLHEGEQLTAGTKYIARTDVMYCRRTPKQVVPQVYRLEQEAEKLEANGQVMEAMELFRAAEKLRTRSIAA